MTDQSPKEGRVGFPYAPPGWFLWKACHQHTPIVYARDKHKPEEREDGAFLVEFQHTDGGWLTSAHGHTIVEAWENAVRAVEVQDARRNEFLKG